MRQSPAWREALRMLLALIMVSATWHIPPKKRRDSEFYAQAVESVVCNKDYIFSVTYITPKCTSRQVSLHSVCPAPPGGHHRPRFSVPEGKKCADFDIFLRGSHSQRSGPRC